MSDTTKHSVTGSDIAETRSRPVSAPVLLGMPKRSIDVQDDYGRDGLPLLSGAKTRLKTGVYANASALSSASTHGSGVNFETNVQLLDLGNGEWCLNHGLRQEQVFGGDTVSRAFADINAGRPAADPDLHQTLIEAGFIAADGAAPEAFHRQLLATEDAKTSVTPSFTLLRVLLTDVCNLSCSYCKVIPNVLAPQAEPTKADRLLEVIEFFFTHSDPARPKIIHMTGGEPTLFFHQVRHIVESAERLARPNENFWFVLGTNATLIGASQARYLAEHDVKCIVSMDGPEKIHDELRQNHGGRGSWKMVDKGVRKLKEAGVEVSLSMVIGQHNLDRAETIIDWFLETYQPTGLGVNFMKPPTPEQADYEYLVDPEVYAENMYRIHKVFRNRGLFLELVFRKLQPFVEQRYRFHDCGAAGGTNLNVDAKGNVGPCKSFLVMDELAMRELDIDKYQSAVVSEWRKRSPIYYTHCEGCSARGMCGNGCAYDAKIHSGDEMSIDIRSCHYTQYFNKLFIRDLLDQVRPSPEGRSEEWWVRPNLEQRQLLLGEVSARPRTLSYSIGHQTMD